MNTGVHVSFQVSVFIFFRCIPKSGIAGSYGSYFQFFEKLPYCFPQWLHQFTFPPMYEGSLFSTSLPTFLLFFYDTHSGRSGVVSHCGFIRISLRINNVEHLFLWLLATCMSSRKISLQVFCSLFNQVVWVFLFCFVFHFRTAPEAYGSSQDNSHSNGVAATGLHHSHSNARSEPHLQPMPQVAAMPDP